MTKRKLYWILMPIFLFLTIITMLLLPDTKKAYGFIIVIIFWIVYSIWSKVIDKKAKLEDDNKKDAH